MKTKFFMVFVIILSSSNIFAGEVMVQSCHDGDTCAVQTEGLAFKVRLVGIDAPEVAGRGQKRGQPFGTESKNFLNAMVAGKVLKITQYGLDPYNRPLVTIEVGKLIANEEMIRAGLAEVYGGKTTYNLKTLERLANEAKVSKRGIWSLGEDYQSPYVYRKKR